MAKPIADARVLVIDDDPILRAIVVQALSAAGGSVVEAEDGEVGLSLLASRAFDLVVTDLIMPNKEGIETIQAIRREWRALPIVAISAGTPLGGADNLLKMASALGADAVMAKPLKTAALLDVIERLLDSANARE